MNTMKAYKSMINAGLEEKQAETITQAIEDAVIKSDLVTKEYLRAELLNTEKKLDAKITDVEKKLDIKITDIKTDLLETEKRLENKINKNLLWMISAMIAMTAIIIAVLK